MHEAKRQAWEEKKIKHEAAEHGFEKARNNYYFEYMMNILLDVEKIGNPKTDSMSLDIFISVKNQILKTLEPYGDKYNNICVVFCITNTDFYRLRFVNYGKDELVDELNDIMNKELDLTKILGELSGGRSN